MKLKIFTFLTLLLLVIGCENTQQPNMLVPATVSENPNLPSVSIKVAGIDRKVHVRTFGTPTNPTLFIIHGSFWIYGLLFTSSNCPTNILIF